MKIYYISLWLVAINVIIFLLQISIAGLTDTFVLVSADIAARPWILLTSMFLHGSTAHLLANMFALGLFGIILEHNIGSKRFLIIYIIGGFIASLVSSYFYESALGASGAIFAALGALAAIRPRMIVWAYGAPMPMYVAAAFWLLLDILGVFYPTNIANMAHIAGLIFGVIIGMAIRKKEPKQTRIKEEKSISEEEFKQWEEEWM